MTFQNMPSKHVAVTERLTQRVTDSDKNGENKLIQTDSGETRFHPKHTWSASRGQDLLVLKQTSGKVSSFLPVFRENTQTSRRVSR